MKYKVGDRVRVNPDAFAPSTKEKMSLGKIVVIERVFNGGYQDAYGGSWFEYELEPASEQRIIIYTDGKTTTAKLIEGKKTIKEAVAKCAPDDEFNFETGARLAFDRLFETKKEKLKLLERFEPFKWYRFTRERYVAAGGEFDDGQEDQWPVKYYGLKVFPKGTEEALVDGLWYYPQWCEEIKDDDDV